MDLIRVPSSAQTPKHFQKGYTSFKLVRFVIVLFFFIRYNTLDKYPFIFNGFTHG